jgi:hypothetical protein
MSLQNITLISKRIEVFARHTPNAMTCSRFSLLKTWLMTTEANFPCGSSALSLLSMAAFHLIIYGRFRVITEVK